MTQEGIPRLQARSKLGDLVLLNTKNMHMTRAMKKLENLHDGPFKVLKKVGA